MSKGKSIWILLLVMVFSMASANQSSRTVPDFTGTDIHGETHSLYEILEGGQYVWIHFTGKF